MGITLSGIILYVCVCALTRTKLSRSLAWTLSSSVRGSLTFISSDRCSLSIKLSMYSCNQNYISTFVKFYQKKKFSGSVVFSTVSHVALEADYLTQLSTFRSRNIAKYHRSCTFSRVSTVFLSGVVNGLCWYSSLISRTLGQPLTGWRCAAELPDLSLRVKLRPMSVPNGGPGLFFWNREKDSVWVCCSPVCTCNICVYVPVLYLCSREIMPAAVSEVGRGNVRVLFPLQPLGPHALVAGL